MRTVGIIVEYNPFHNGHLYHLQQSLKITKSDAVVAVMSGQFLQRGEPALLNKWTRTEMALRGGCDVVIELPVAYSTQAAEWFAYGAAALLDATGVVDALCFGSEAGDIAPLRRVARLLAHEPSSFGPLMADELRTGRSYPAAYSGAVRRFMAEAGDEEAAAFPFEQPNNTLGLHYLLALERLGSAIEPFSLRREKAGYAQTSITDAQIASATAIRKLVAESLAPEGAAPFVPPSTMELLLRDHAIGRARGSWEHYAAPLFHKLVSESAEALGRYHEMSEGLEHRIKNALPELESLAFEPLLERLKTKRYTRTKLQRALLSILLGHDKELLSPDRLRTGVQYIRVLGCSPRGRELLKRMRKSAKLPVLQSAARAAKEYPYLALDVQATSIYALGWPDAAPRDLFRDYYEKPISIE
ncbi:nucleotidyltransferase [Paenibacillus sacheonensis]|uniref:tRNA(Met) cytidine acetate ligase n=1 Tax=Paenibacillus sacheonensis TaxID=742054 RepID=A0A7X4YMJ1_9BACL|nr:nucleotidyltransferase [Paenibacillus sacheonensis]MBM7564568.1 putative nucleotidyltransferase [Paenibacillus sacheonensis]NBC69125.1 nucleotidyltransferase [Paenibacillus sacheonensis]